MDAALPPNALAARRVLLIVSGGIAAYKAPDVVRRLRDAGAEVQVVMTPAAGAFITPLTLQAVSGREVRAELFDPAAEAAMGHIELARWADVILIAPATADFLARLRLGMANDLASAVCLASEAPILAAPAMNQQMWKHPATQDNLAALAARGVRFAGPGAGSQACGEVGPGRMLEATEICAATAALFERDLLSGVRVLLTAGPTREPIDPVRYISNHSSGKMGYAIATALREAGAIVTLVSGPTILPPPAGVTLVNVETARDMHEAVMARLPTDIFVATAAVADYRIDNAASNKIKRSDSALELKLVPNPDILKCVAASAAPPFTVGFAAETNDVERHARDKLERKAIDMVAANLVGGAGLGFNADDNELMVIWRDGSRLLPRAAKTRLARTLVDVIAERYAARAAR
ncbi:MAG: bifunctional phosphopantothenoylcysteine decarboxylase/phosphopantothenate--cysteine ligase CoaBC [Gammaproteobacteria bacterium]|nr:bifunctional phosphopantothenoylcysteine decarboxylase/phosphopantothenate--cysteine ligase CoaBC [Gammaproteobacteria bacterium]